MDGAGHGGNNARGGSQRATSSRSTSASPMVPAVGRYQVMRLLGEGAMGRVYQARDPELGRDVAIKVLRLDAAGNARDAYIARFRNEARAAARFNHPNVVSVHDAGVDPTLGPYLVYEYVAGPTLRSRIQQGRMEPAEVVSIGRGIASALDALHAAEILHRDIKPDNILLSEATGSVKLTDFGIARVPDAQLTREGQFLGTPAYASPEAITRGEYSSRGDVFSLAAVLYEALCGIRPFPGEDAVSVSYAVANDVPPPPSKYVPDLPPGVDAAFMKALAKRASERHASAGELAGAIYSAFRAANAPRATSTASASADGSSMRPSAPSLIPPAKRPQHAPRGGDKAAGEVPNARRNTGKNPAVRAGASAKSDPGADRLRGPAIVTAIVLLVLAFVIARKFARPEPAAEPTVSASATATEAPSAGASGNEAEPDMTHRGSANPRGGRVRPRNGRAN